jgi:hypothetical protein
VGDGGDHVSRHRHRTCGKCYNFANKYFRMKTSNNVVIVIQNKSIVYIIHKQ